MTDYAAKLKEVQDGLTKEPMGIRPAMRKFGISQYKLLQWEEAGLIKLTRVKPGKGHNWMRSAPLSRKK